MANINNRKISVAALMYLVLSTAPLALNAQDAPAGDALSSDDASTASVELTLQLNTLMTQARTAMGAGKYQDAIDAYQRIIAHPESVHFASALEFLGVAYERLGLYGQAKSVYDNFLSSFPDSDDSARIQQRIDALPSFEDRPQALPEIAATEEFSDTQLDKLMESARQAMAQQGYSRAIGIYTKILELPDNKFRENALEFIGVARERRNQLAHAKALYEQYLQHYPEGDGAIRVQQRLAALITAEQAPQEKLRKLKTQEEKSKWDLFGSIAQTYRRNEFETDDTPREVTQSLLDTNLDLNARRRTENSEVRARLTGGYDYDFLDRSGDEFEITALYVDGTHHQRGLNGRIGRQRGRSGGVYGRFDGILGGYRINELTRINIVSGFPVSSSELDRLEIDTFFYGINTDLGPFNRSWNFNVFFVDQYSHGLNDRRAIGGELRYFTANRSLLGVIDYDIFYNKLNNLLLQGTLALPRDTALNTIINIRQSPLLTTNNALISQTGVDDLNELRDMFSDEAIHDLALDRTAVSRSYTLGASHRVNDSYQLNGDITITSLSSTDPSGGVAALEATGNDFLYSIQLTGTNLFSRRDLTLIRLRYKDKKNSDTVSLSINSRLQVSNALRVNPRLSMDFTTETDDSSERKTRPSLIINYRVRQRYHFELEVGAELEDRDFGDTRTGTSIYFLNAGFRLDFS